jgi:hypothetical protein
MQEDGTQDRRISHQTSLAAAAVRCFVSVRMPHDEAEGNLRPWDLEPFIGSNGLTSLVPLMQLGSMATNDQTRFSNARALL